MSAGADLSGLAAPGLEAIEAVARAIFDRLPQEFRDACGDVVIRVADFPEEDVVESMALESEFDLLGLFEGTGHAQRGDPLTGEMPNLIWLYRRPILDYWSAYDETLGEVVAHVLIHEIGHHLGFSDEDMERIEAAAEGMA